MGKKLVWKQREKKILGIVAIALYQSSGKNYIFLSGVPFDTYIE
jgi:hypothetical protein